jgi:transposase
VEEVEDEPLFCERVAGIDIGKAAIMVTIRVPGKNGSGRRRQETREYRTVRKDLLALANWLREWDVARAGMEATGDYWKPVYYLLEREGFDCGLYPASRVRALPGRPKTGKLDSVWLAKITERGSLASSFVPPRRHPGAAHPYPLPAPPGAGPHRRDGALREAAGGRLRQAVVGDHQHPR